MISSGHPLSRISDDSNENKAGYRLLHVSGTAADAVRYGDATTLLGSADTRVLIVGGASKSQHGTMARPLALRSVAFLFGCVVLLSMWSIKLFFLDVRAPLVDTAAKLAEVNKGLEQEQDYSCSAMLTEWLGRLGPAHESGAPHVKTCRKCCSCDWSTVEHFLTAPEPQMDCTNSGKQEDYTFKGQCKQSTDNDSGTSVEHECDAEENNSSNSQWFGPLLHSSNRSAWRPWMADPPTIQREIPDCGMCYGCSHTLLPNVPCYRAFNFTFKALPLENYGMEVGADEPHSCIH